MAVNFGGTYAMSRAFAPVIERGGGSAGVAVHGVYPAGIGTEMLAAPSIPHSSPRQVAEGLLDGVEAGDEDIVPCALSRAEAETYQASPKALERLHSGPH
jgi:NAD(P)-dependent dehydrogenase (short-subunit alcohol dehydrogenase family)